MGDVRITWLSDLSKKNTPLAGGKGANLGEMYNAKFPVPTAFVVTTKAFFYFIKKTKLEEQIKSILKKIDVDNTAELNKKSEEIRELIKSAEMPEDLRSEILEAYDHFNVDLGGLEDSPGALAILKSSREPVFVSVRSSATAEDLGEASFAGQQESFINIKGNPELIDKVKACFASIFTSRSIYYRKKKGFDDLVGIAAIVQKMVNSEKSGVMFSKHPVTNADQILIEAVFGQGEGIVSGKIKPDQYVVSNDMEILSESVSDKKIAIIRTAAGRTISKQLDPEFSKSRVLKTYEIKQLAEYAQKLEKHYGVPQDIEFAVEDNDIYILQTRPITTLKKEGESKHQEFDGQVICSGLAASPGVASGMVRIVNGLDELDKVQDGDIMVTKMTNPDMVVAMQRAAAIVTSEGGVTAHAAIVSREMGIPAVVGTGNALDVLQDGQEITVDGFNGKVFAGHAENKSVEIKPIIETKTEIKTLVDLPKFAKRAAESHAHGVGLIRLEGLIASNGKHPLAYEAEGKLDEYQKVLQTGLAEIAEHFVGKPLWVRSSDIRSDEYSGLEGAPKKIEKNPMLGLHGIRFSLKHPEIFKAELKAVHELAKKGNKFGVMFPQVISVEEVQKARKIFDELGIDNVEFGAMIETPAAVVLIKDICESGVDFISFGTNDLTQFTLAVDRGNETVQHLYSELSWAVKKQLSRVIRECKKHGVKTSICGQAGSNPEMVEFLVKQGIDSVSVNADAAYDISLLIKKIEDPTSSEHEDARVEKENNGSQKEVPAVPKIESIDNENSLKKELEEREEDYQKKVQEDEERTSIEIEDIQEDLEEKVKEQGAREESEPSDDTPKKEEIFDE